MRLATRAHGTAVARQAAARAYVRAAGHQSVGVGFDVLCRKLGLGERPEAALDALVARESANCEVPREHALYVAIEDRFPRAERKHRNRRGGGAPQAGERLQRLPRARKPAPG